MVNKVFLIGNVGSDPEVRTLDNGSMVANFSLATSETYKDKSGETVTNTAWHNIVAWKHLADLADNYIRKGRQLFIEGKITYRTYTDKDGNKRGTTDIVAENIRLLGSKDGAAKSTENRQNEGAGRSTSGSGPELPEPDNVRTVEETDDLPF